VRELAKSAARGVALLVVLPALCSFWLRRPLIGADRALQGSTQALGLLPGLLGQYLRRAFLARVLAHCAPTAAIEFGTTFSAVGARIDERAYIGPNCHIGLAHVHRDVLIAPCVHVPSGGRVHGISDVTVPIRDQAGEPTMVHIGAGAWIGTAAIVMSDVGEGTIVAAAAVVTKPLPAYIIAGGIPARLIRPRESAPAAVPGPR
jgi:acetyltransferase-like isoleucine patch superfamily enzyme